MLTNFKPMFNAYFNGLKSAELRVVFTKSFGQDGANVHNLEEYYMRVWKSHSYILGNFEERGFRQNHYNDIDAAGTITVCIGAAGTTKEFRKAMLTFIKELASREWYSSSTSYDMLDRFIAAEKDSSLKKEAKKAFGEVNKRITPQ